MATFNTQAHSPTVKWWQSLRFNLMLVLIAISVIPILVIGLSLASRFHTRTIEQVTDQLQSVMTLKTSDLHTWLDTAHSTLDIVAENPLLISPIHAVLLSGESDTSRVNRLNDVLDKTIIASNVLDSAFIYDLSGRVLLASNPADIGKVVARQPYFQPSLTATEYYVQPPFYDLSTAELIVIGTRPITNNMGELVGVIAGRLNTQTLSNIMLELNGLGETGETYLVSRQNNYFLTPSRFEGYDTNRAYTSYGIEQALNQIEGSGLYDDYRNPPVPVIGTYSWIPELQSAILVEIDEAEALSAFNQALVSGLGFAGIVLSIAILIGIYMGQRVSKPITQLAQTAYAIANGDLTSRAQVSGDNEIAILGNSFNQMTENLVQNIQQLDENYHKLEEANRELETKTAMAREATRLKSEFLATMSHELRTPLNAITGFTGILMFDADELPEDSVHMLQRIDANASRLLKLIDDVLDLSKIEAGRVEIVEEPIHVETLVNQWIAETAVLAENKRLPLHTEVSPDFPHKIFGDSARLTQIAKNLLSNAIKFTDNGSVNLNVTVSDEYWQIVVSDTGIGIPPHARNYIFDEFRQVDGSSRRVYGGTGLGLAITRNLVLMMHGTITVDSELGEGSTFTVRLPLRIAEVAEPAMSI